MYRIFFSFIFIVVIFSCNRKEEKNGKTINSMFHAKETKNDSCFYVEIEDSVIINTIKLFSKEYNLKNKFVCLNIFENYYQYEIILTYNGIDGVLVGNYYTSINDQKVLIQLGFDNPISYKRDMIDELKKNLPEINFSHRVIYEDITAWKLILCKNKKENYKLIRNSNFAIEFCRLFSDTLCYYKFDINKFLPDTTPPKKINLNIDSIASLHSKR